MTAAALAPKCPFVDIVTSVATATIAGDFGRAVAAFPMALVATQRSMRTIQRKLGLRAVVELSQTPVTRVVTMSTTRTKRALVAVVLAVAAVTSLGGIAIQRGGVAVGTGHDAMRAEQHKSHLVVIELRRLPGGFVVTIGADSTELAAMRIFFVVTADAGDR